MSSILQQMNLVGKFADCMPEIDTVNFVDQRCIKIADNLHCEKFLFAFKWKFWKIPCHCKSVSLNLLTRDFDYSQWNFKI